MKHVIIGAVMALTGTSVAAEASLHTHQYTGQPDQPVISLDYQGSRVPRINRAPTLSIFADGRVEMPKNYAHMRGYSGRISQSELQQLLDLAIREQKFFAIDERGVQAKLGAPATATRGLPEHLSTTVVTVTADGTSKSVRYFGLGHDRMIEEAQQLLTIRERLEQVMAVTKLGGESEARRWLALANAELASRSAGSAPLSLAHLRSAAIHDDGSAHVRFVRAAAQEKQLSVSISVDRGGASTIAVAHDDLPHRSVGLD